MVNINLNKIKMTIEKILHVELFNDGISYS